MKDESRKINMNNYYLKKLLNKVMYINHRQHHSKLLVHLSRDRFVHDSNRVDNPTHFQEQLDQILRKPTHQSHPILIGWNRSGLRVPKVPRHNLRHLIVPVLPKLSVMLAVHHHLYLKIQGDLQS